MKEKYNQMFFKNPTVRKIVGKTTVPSQPPFIKVGSLKMKFSAAEENASAANIWPQHN